MKKLFSYLLLLSVIIIFMAACSSSGEAPSSDNSSSLQYDAQHLVRSDAGSNQVTLEWYMDPQAQTYNIRYLEDDGTNTRPAYAKMKTVTATPGIKSAPYTVTGLKASTTYWFSISGVNSIQESYLWLPIKSITTDSPPPPAPEDVRPNPEDTKVTITWKPVIASPAVGSYKIYCYYQDGLNAGVGQAITIDGQSSSSKVVDLVYWQAGSENGTSIAGTTTALKNGRTYYFYVTAVNSVGESSPSFAIYATPSKTPPPFAPVFTGISVGSFNIGGTIYNTKVSWNASIIGETPVVDTSVTSYTIYVGGAKGITKSTGAPSTYVPDVGDTGPYFAGAILSSGTYYIVVTATNANGESAESNEMPVTIP